MKLGLGCMRLPDEGGAAVITAALDAGATLLDTADVYGTEALVAAAARPGVTLVTKGGMTRQGKRWIPNGKAKAPPRCGGALGRHLWLHPPLPAPRPRPSGGPGHQPASPGQAPARRGRRDPRLVQHHPAPAPPGPGRVRRRRRADRPVRAPSRGPAQRARAHLPRRGHPGHRPPAPRRAQEGRETGPGPGAGGAGHQARPHPRRAGPGRHRRPRHRAHSRLLTGRDRRIHRTGARHWPRRRGPRRSWTLASQPSTSSGARWSNADLLAPLPASPSPSDSPVPASRARCATWSQPVGPRLNRDERGGSLRALLPAMTAALDAGDNVVLDNTYLKRAWRNEVL